MTRSELLAVAKPILFNTEMVQAIKDNRKTVTRRVVKYTANDVYGMACVNGVWYEGYNPQTPPGKLVEWYVKGIAESHYRPGDILYIPEAWKCRKPPNPGTLGYEAVFRDGFITKFQFTDKKRFGKWKKYWDKPDQWQSPYFMPKEAARIFLRVTDVRVERLREITELDILEKEGVTVDFPQPKPSYMSLAYTETRLKPAVRKAFADLWDSTIKPADLALYGWGANPWVWVIEFERVEV